MFLYLKMILCYVLGVEKNPQTRLQKYTGYYFDYSCSNWIFLQIWKCSKGFKNKGGTFFLLLGL